MNAEFSIYRFDTSDVSDVATMVAGLLAVIVIATSAQVFNFNHAETIARLTDFLSRKNTSLSLHTTRVTNRQDSLHFMKAILDRLFSPRMRNCFPISPALG
jgi:hypothetical protein